MKHFRKGKKMTDKEKYIEAQNQTITELKNHIDQLLVRLSELENENAVLKEEIIELQKEKQKPESLSFHMRITT